MFFYEQMRNALKTLTLETMDLFHNMEIFWEYDRKGWKIQSP